VLAALTALPVTSGAWNRWFSLATAAAFLLAVAVEVWLWISRPEKRWYDGRAVAESMKTLSWRYAVGAQPFPTDLAAADDAYLSSAGDLLRDAPATDIPPAGRPLITPAMRSLRAAPLAERREAYLRDRIDDQRDWYAAKTEACRVRARRWRVALLTGEIAGVALALLRAAGVVSADLAGLTAAGVGAGASWLAVRQFDFLARAYTYAHGELTLARERLVLAADEAAWAAEAADAEEAVSREHTMWRASRSSISI
jgi:conflict system pore-forming effector with SLATT domain